MDLLVGEMGAGQAVKVGPKTTTLPPSGHGRLLLASTCHAPKHPYLLGFSHIGTPGTRQEVTIDHFGSTMSARLQFRCKNEVNGAPQEVNIGHLCLHHDITMITKLSKVSSKIDSGSLQDTLLATPVSQNSKLQKFVLL